MVRWARATGAGDVDQTTDVHQGPSGRSASPTAPRRARVEPGVPVRGWPVAGGGADVPSPLTGILSPKLRQDVYTTYAAVGLLIGCVQAAIGAVSSGPMPDFLKAALAVYAFIGTAIGATAASNVTLEDDDGHPVRRTRRGRRSAPRTQPRTDAQTGAADGATRPAPRAEDG